MTEHEATARAVWGFNTPIGMPVPVIAYLTGLSFRDVCRAVELGGFFIEDDRSKAEAVFKCGRRIKY